MLTYGYVIKFYRKLRKMKQIELARQLKISRSYICSLEKNQKESLPSAETSLRIARTLDINKNMLLKLSGKRLRKDIKQEIIQARKYFRDQINLYKE